jgi:uncharacterized membrane protein YidH (DUF202 family)
MWLRDPQNGRESVTLSLLVYGVGLASFKLLVSDLKILGIQFPSFNGSDFALVLGAVAGLYGWRKHQKNRRQGRKTDNLTQMGYKPNNRGPKDEKGNP